MPELRPSLSTVYGGPYRWLLSLRIGGRWVRVTSGTDGSLLEITGKDGTVYTFEGGLAPANYERILDLWNASAAPRSQSFEVLLSWDIALQIARGQPVFAAEGEFAQWYEGTTWEERRVVLRGVINEPSYGALGEPFAFALVEDPGDDQAIEPDPRKVVAEGVTFLESGNFGPDGGVVGAVYPTIIGAPGQAKTMGTTGTLSEELAGSPALFVVRDATRGSTTVTDYKVLIAGHPVTATSVRIWNKTQDQTWTATPQTARDLVGNVYAYVNPSSAGVIPYDGDELYCIWDPDNGGGLRNPFGTGTLRGAGDVIRWALNRATFRIDHSRLAELSVLNAYAIDTFINSPVSPWAWVSSNLLPLLPVTVGVGPDGLYVTPWLHRDLRADQALIELEHGRNVERDGGLVYSSWNEASNDITLRFGPAADTGNYALRRRVSPDDYDPNDPDSRPDFWCRRSFGVLSEVLELQAARRVLALDSSAIFDAATAEAVLASMSRRHSFPRREVVVAAGRELDWLRPGDVVTYTDADVHLASSCALVGSIGYGADNLVIQLVLFEPLVFAA